MKLHTLFNELPATIISQLKKQVNLVEISIEDGIILETIDPARVQIMVSPLFRDTMAKYKNNPKVVEALREFLKRKAEDPLQPYGSKDYPFKGGDLVGYRHAGLTFDTSIIYTLKGRNPTVISLYGVYSHDELGTGNPPNQRRQKQASKTLGNQSSWDPHTEEPIQKRR